jgi:hypothetical protein
MASPRPVKGECPKGCGETLILDAEGQVVCSWLQCPDPTAAAKELSELSEPVFTEDFQKRVDAKAQPDPAEEPPDAAA